MGQVETHCKMRLYLFLDNGILKRFHGADEEHRIVPGPGGGAFPDDGGGAVADSGKTGIREHFQDPGALEAEVVDPGRVVVEGTVLPVQVGDADDSGGVQELVKEPE